MLRTVLMTFWGATCFSYILMIIQGLIYSGRGFMRNAYGRRTSLKIINESLRLASDSRERKWVMRFKINYCIFWGLFCVSIILFIVFIVFNYRARL